jgi:hypothetical protein
VLVASPTYVRAMSHACERFQAFSTRASDYALIARQAGHHEGIKTWHAQFTKLSMDVSIKVVDLEQNDTVFASMQVCMQKIHVGFWGV